MTLTLTACSPYLKCVITEKDKTGLYLEATELKDANHIIIPSAEWITADQLWLKDTVWIHKKTLHIRVDSKTELVYRGK